MKFFIVISCLVSSASAAPEVELIPEDRMGARARVVVQRVEWNCSHKDWGKPVQVCKRVPGKNDFGPMEAVAKEYGMTRRMKWEGTLNGKPGDGTIVYENDTGGFAMMNPNRDLFLLRVRPYDDFKRDADWLPILKGQPSKERAVEICREWMKKLRIDEKEISRREKGITGFNVNVYEDAVGTSRDNYKGDPKHIEKSFRRNADGTLTPDDNGNLKNLRFVYGSSVIFCQQIGNYAAFYSGEGGSIRFDLADGGEFSMIRYCLRGWEPMGEYEILDRDEISQAVKEGFCWSHNIIETEAIRIDNIELDAYHAFPEDPQKTFPLIYRLIVRGAHESRDAEYDTLYLPALKIHRHAYGKATPRGEDPLPEGLPEGLPRK